MRPSAARSASDVKITPRADGYRVQFAFETLDEALEAAERLGAHDARLSAGSARYHRAPHGAISSVG